MEKTLLPDCVFCQPKTQGNQFMQSNDFLAIYNLSPILPGHSLVIPKWHATSLMDLSDSELSEITLFARDVVKVLMRAFHAAAFNWTIQEGAEAGQSVPHLHLHLIPREENDLPGPGNWYPLLKKNEEEIIDSESRPKLSPQEMTAIAERLRAEAKK